VEKIAKKVPGNTMEANHLAWELIHLWTDAFNAASGNTKERALAVTPAICLQYKLLYYAGHGGTLAMPSDMAKAYQATP
jgi:hypothetical protein